jgi:hypothetical protein
MGVVGLHAADDVDTGLTDAVGREATVFTCRTRCDKCT